MTDPNTDMEPPDLSQVDWKDVIYTLREERCILFLGPGAYQAPGGGDLKEGLKLFLEAEDPEHPHIRQYNHDGFFLFRKNRYQRRIAASIRDYYNQDFPETERLFSQLAQIPFPTVFLVNSDNLMTRTFDNLGLNYQWDFYFRNRKATEKFESPSSQTPLIYNLLGNIEEPESLILTHQDFFDYLESAFEGNSMSPELQDELEGAERFIFLGLPYEKWYFQLILRVLALHSEKLKEAERLALKEFEDPKLGTVYQQDFRIEFIPLEPQHFVDELYRQCESAGILRRVIPEAEQDGSAELDEDHLKDLVAKAETGKAMLELKHYLDGRRPRSLELGNELVVLRNRFNLLIQRDRKGTIYPQDFQVENNQMVEDLLALISKAQNI